MPQRLHLLKQGGGRKEYSKIRACYIQNNLIVQTCTAEENLNKGKYSPSWTLEPS